VLTDANVGELVERAAYLSKADTERLVVSIRPRAAPRDGVRLVRPAGTSHAPAAPSALPPADAALASCAVDVPPALAPFLFEAKPPPAPPRAEVRPVAAETYSLRVTIDADCKAELDQLVALLSHSTHGDLAKVLREAIRCALAKHGKRKGAVAPGRKTAPEAPRVEPSDPRYIPAEVRRAVWTRDRRCCAWVSPDGKRCGSTWKLQLGHIVPVALGGESTVDNVRLECATHNALEAVRVFGREHMARAVGARTRPTFREGVTTPGGSHPS
jgi:5-methylcytosine-specific restriction endonuclease McrA